MSDESMGAPWSDNPNAPLIPGWLYPWEKTYFAGIVIGTILYGALTVEFFYLTLFLLSSFKVPPLPYSFNALLH
jgi:hypothetical protein